MMELAICSTCDKGYRRQFYRKVSTYSKSWKDDQGHTTYGNQCYECGYARSQSKAEARNLGKPCPHCNQPTPNRYACDRCWRTKKGINHQDVPEFTAKERQKIYKELEDNVRFKYTTRN